MIRRAVRFALLGCAACGPEGPEQPPLRLEAMIAFPPKDTVQLSLPASARWCSDGRSLLVESLSPEASGVMIRLRYRDTLRSDSFPIVPPTDTTTVPAAAVGIRFFVHDTPRGYTLDSGVVEARRAGGSVALSGRGVGVENAIRIRVLIESQDVPLGADSVQCGYSP